MGPLGDTNASLSRPKSLLPDTKEVPKKHFLRQIALPCTRQSGRRRIHLRQRLQLTFKSGPAVV